MLSTREILIEAVVACLGACQLSYHSCVVAYIARLTVTEAYSDIVAVHDALCCRSYTVSAAVKLIAVLAGPVEACDLLRSDPHCFLTEDADIVIILLYLVVDCVLVSLACCRPVFSIRNVIKTE